MIQRVEALRLRQAFDADAQAPFVFDDAGHAVFRDRMVNARQSFFLQWVEEHQGFKFLPIFMSENRGKDDPGRH